MKLPKSYYNWLSLVGTFLAVFFFFLILLLFALNSIFDLGASYVGLILYIVLPGMMILGLILIPIGMLLRMRKDKRRGLVEGKRLPFVDLNIKGHRNAFIIVTLSTIILLFATSIGSYEAFHYTESVEFCGTLCHKVMQPEYVAYQSSAHERVACVECHVGAGTDWYVRSKLSGLYQVYAVLTKIYPKPIPTPIHNLRPARETCEECHWPEKFYARKMRVQKSFLADEDNTEWDIILQMKIGPTYSAMGLDEGIHWHINPNTKIEYICDDEKRENIVWVKYTDKATGKYNIYWDEDNMPEDSVIQYTPKRTMDCMDCHNRPSHNYQSPPDYMDQLLTSGKVSKKIPNIKAYAMEFLMGTYPTQDTAMMEISNGLITYYKDDHSDFYVKNTDLVENAIKNIQLAYSRNAFPEMGVTYDQYPNHIGHMETNGCFRCHNDRFKSKAGRTISRDCNICHSIVGQGRPDSMQMSTFYQTLEFKHPVDIDQAWKEYSCSECHLYLY
ncbi:cytochrome c3 family protein [Bacteroidota bacterium]